MTDQQPNPVEIAGAMLRKRADRMAIERIEAAHKRVCEQLSTGPHTTYDDEGLKRLLGVHRDNLRNKIEEEMAGALVKLCMDAVAKKEPT